MEIRQSNKSRHSRSRRALLKSALALASLSVLGACGQSSPSDKKRAARLREKLAIRNTEHTWIPLPNYRRSQLSFV